MTNQVVGSAYVADKTPAEIDDWQINWASRGLGSDTITSSNWAVSAVSEGIAADLGIVTPVPSIGSPATTTTVWLSGGIAGNQYIVTNTVRTSGNRTLEESFIVNCVTEHLIGACT